MSLRFRSVLAFIALTLVSASCVRVKPESGFQGIGQSKQADRPFENVKGGKISDLDPLASKDSKGEIDVSNGKGYYASIVDHNKVADEYKKLAADLEHLSPEDLSDPEIKGLRDGLVKKLNSAVNEIQTHSRPIFRFYAPFVSVTQKLGNRNATKFNIGAHVVHLQLGIVTENIDPHLFSLADPNTADTFLGKAMIWCRNQACQMGNFFKSKKRVVGLRGGFGLGHSAIFKGSVAINWHRGVDSLGNIAPGKFGMELEASTLSGLAAYTAYVDFDGPKPKLRLPAGMVLNADTTSLLTQAFNAVVAASLGLDADQIDHDFGFDANPIAIDEDYYIGVKSNGKLAAANVNKAFGPDDKKGFVSADLEIKSLQPDETSPAAMKIIGNNLDCGK